MKKLPLLFLSISLLLVLISAAQRPVRKGFRSVRDTTVVHDVVEYYEEVVDARQTNFLHQLRGGWNLNIMKRQARMAEETLQNAYLVFDSDSTFSGQAGCNRISGRFVVKGTGIRFSNITTTNMACDKLEQESALLRLLQQTVSTYAVSEDQLLLRDGSSNIIFSASRRKE